MLGLLSLVSLLYFPVIIVSVMLWLSLAGFKVSIDEVTRLLWIILSYFGYFFIISLVCVLVSATSKTSKSSLIKLISIWLLFIVIMPRAAQAFGSYTHPAPSKIDFDTRVESELIKAGDSHNPDDIHYKGIKDSLLKTYKVATVEELPFNYSGYIMAEGEKLSAGIYNKYWNEQLNIYEKQNNISTYLSFINPFLAIQNLSMAITGSDFNSYVSYQEQVEEYRYKLAQLMNKLQMENISNKKQGATDKPYTISKDHWKEMPDFSYRFIGQKDLFRNEISAILSLIIWGAGLLFLIHFMSKKIKIY